MSAPARLLFGPLAAVVFAIGVAAMALWVPGYNAMGQTVSEIGQMSSPMRWPFAALLWLVALFMVVFATGLWDARPPGATASAALAAACTAWMGVAAAALGWFAYPAPLHNLFGLSELIAYQAPLWLAIAWRKQAPAAAAFSWAMYVLTLLSLAFNLAALLDNGNFWRLVKPVYGLVQRSLFACFFVWCGGAGWLLWRRAVKA
jgi:hypothetical protein